MRIGLIATITTLLLTPSLYAQVRAEKVVNGVTVVIDADPGSPGNQDFPSGAAIAITGVDNSVSMVRIYSTTSPVMSNAGSTTISGSRTSATPLDVLIGSGEFPLFSETNIPSPSLGHLGGLTITDTGGGNLLTNSRLAGAIAGDVTGDINVGEIFRLQIGDFPDYPPGNLKANLTAHKAFPQGQGGDSIRQLIVGGNVGEVGTTAVTPTIKAVNGDIRNILVGIRFDAAFPEGGDLLGNVLAEQGSIWRLRAIRSIGTGTRGIGTSVAVTAQNDIAFIQSQFGYLDITAGLGDGTGRLQSFRSVGLTLNNTFYGTINAKAITAFEPTIDPAFNAIEADAMASDITIAGDMTLPLRCAVDYAGTIRVAGNLTSQEGTASRGT